MTIEKRIRRNIIKSIRKSIKTPSELIFDMARYDYGIEIVGSVIGDMMLNGELIPDQNLKLDLWRPK